MQVILLEKVANLGVLGDIVKVKDGFGRNFLIRKARLNAQQKLTRLNSLHVVLSWKNNKPLSWLLPRLVVKIGWHCCYSDTKSWCRWPFIRFCY